MNIVVNWLIGRVTFFEVEFVFDPKSGTFNSHQILNLIVEGIIHICKNFQLKSPEEKDIVIHILNISHDR